MNLPPPSVPLAPLAGTETETPVLPEVEEEVSLDAPWNVLLHNDPVNLMGYVVLTLRKIFGFSEAEAEDVTVSCHENGRAIVWSGERETAELYVEQLHASQLMASIEQSES